jgi:signal transduction histidine kinase
VGSHASAVRWKTPPPPATVLLPDGSTTAATGASGGADAGAAGPVGFDGVVAHEGLIAHELRSPLAMIQGWVDVLRAGGLDDAEVAVALEAVDAQVGRLRRLADDALDAAGVAGGRLALDLAPADLGRAVAAAVAARPGRAAVVVVAEDGVVARIDRGRFDQVLHNLLDNAGAHGTGAPSVDVRRDGAEAEVVITSPGPPIAPDLARQLFEPFERGTTAGQGVGLGLYVCRTLVVAHGGRVGVRSDHLGNHFWLRLPAEGP